MPNPYFSFKQFKVYHDKCGMKVGTDAVLLGAWTNCVFANSILDVGTGTGLIALMTAQRSAATVTAIDIDKDAYLQACQNIIDSPWHNRIIVQNISFQEFRTYQKFDLIVSNPPYFTNSHKASNVARNIARHSDCMPFELLISKSANLLNANGKLSVILPTDVHTKFVRLAHEARLFLNRTMYVYPKPNKSCKRILLEFSFRQTEIDNQTICIENGHQRHSYSNEYMALTKDFYLSF